MSDENVIDMTERRRDELFVKAIGMQCSCGVSISFPSAWKRCPKCHVDLRSVFEPEVW